MSSGNGFAVVFGELRSAATQLREIENAVADLDRDGLCDGGAAYGDAGLRASATTFADRWSAGLSGIAAEAAACADLMTATTDAYERTDADVAGALPRPDQPR